MARRLTVAAFFIFIVPALFFAGDEKVISDDELKLEEMFEVRLKEVHFNVTPGYKIVWPDTSAKISIKQKWEIAELSVETEYNFIYSEMKYALTYTMDMFLTFTGSLYDSISFEKIYENNKFLQRNRGFEVGLKTPKMLGFLSVRESVKNEAVYFSRLEEEFAADDTNLLIFNTWFEAIFINHKKIRTGYFCINFENAVPHQISPYNFMFLNLKMEGYFDSEKHHISARAETGHLLENYGVALWKVYSLGGFDRLIGYDYGKYQGYYKAFGRLQYKYDMLDDLECELPLAVINNAKLLFIVDGGTVSGSAADLLSTGNYKYGIAAGLEINLTFRKQTKMKFTLAVAQPSHASGPYFYFVHEL